MLLRGFLLITAAVLGASKPPKQPKNAGEVTPNHLQSWVDGLIEKYDADKNEFLTSDEVSEWVQGNEIVLDEEDLKVKMKGMMEMADEDSDEKVTRAELYKFLKKMKDMDGHLDRLPDPDVLDQDPPPTRPLQHRRQNRNKKQKPKKSESRENARELPPSITINPTVAKEDAAQSGLESSAEDTKWQALSDVKEKFGDIKSEL